MKRKLLAAVVLLAIGVGATGYVLFAPTRGRGSHDPVSDRHRHHRRRDPGGGRHRHRLGQLHLGSRASGGPQRSSPPGADQLGRVIERHLDRDGGERRHSATG